MGKQNYPNEWEHYLAYGKLVFPWPYNVDLTVEVVDGEKIFSANYPGGEIPVCGFGGSAEECLRHLMDSTFAYFNYLKTIGGEPPKFVRDARVRDWTPKKK